MKLLEYHNRGQRERIPSSAYLLRLADDLHAPWYPKGVSFFVDPGKDVKPGDWACLGVRNGDDNEAICLVRLVDASTERVRFVYRLDEYIDLPRAAVARLHSIRHSFVSEYAAADAVLLTELKTINTTAGYPRRHDGA